MITEVREMIEVGDLIRLKVIMETSKVGVVKTRTKVSRAEKLYYTLFGWKVPNSSRKRSAKSTLRIRAPRVMTGKSQGKSHLRN